MSEMPEPDKILRVRTVLERTGLSRSTLYRKMHDGTFPNQIRISEHCRGWRESAINRSMADPTTYSDEDARRMFNGGSASRQRVLA
jgi:prophage regulatory protein